MGLCYSILNNFSRILHSLNCIGKHITDLLKSRIKSAIRIPQPPEGPTVEDTCSDPIDNDVDDDIDENDSSC